MKERSGPPTNERVIIGPALEKMSLFTIPIPEIRRLFRPGPKPRWERRIGRARQENEREAHRQFRRPARSPEVNFPISNNFAANAISASDSNASAPTFKAASTVSGYAIANDFIEFTRFFVPFGYWKSIHLKPTRFV